MMIRVIENPFFYFINKTFKKGKRGLEMILSQTFTVNNRLL